MIVDCYTHTWESAEQLGRCLPLNGKHAPFPEPLGDPLRATPARHIACAEPVDTTIVLGFKTRYLEAEISNEQVASYVADHPDRLIGFAGIDPSEPKEAIADLERARDELSMRGLPSRTRTTRSRQFTRRPNLLLEANHATQLNGCSTRSRPT